MWEYVLRELRQHCSVAVCMQSTHNEHCLIVGTYHFAGAHASQGLVAPCSEHAAREEEA